MFDWNDLKAFLGVARGGSTLAAAKALGVNQTTVARRVESLEQSLGLKLFERGQAGSRLTEAGRDLIGEAERVEAACETFSNRAQAHGRGLAGAIKLTCTEVMANAVVTPAIGKFRQSFPEVHVNLLISDFPLDIANGEADLGIRTTHLLPSSDLVVRKLVDYQFALYCSRDYAARRGVPASLAELKNHDLIGGEATVGMLPGVDWMLGHAEGKAPAHTSNSMTNLVHAVRAGLGIAPLPCILADAQQRLLRCSEPFEDARFSSWLVMRRELKDSPRIRAFIDFLVPYVQQEFRAREASNRRLREQAADNDQVAAEIGESA